jgi:hypothetical protein
MKSDIINAAMNLPAVHISQKTSTQPDIFNDASEASPREVRVEDLSYPNIRDPLPPLNVRAGAQTHNVLDEYRGSFCVKSAAQRQGGIIRTPKNLAAVCLVII